jgi:hypothetical protein
MCGPTWTACHDLSWKFVCTTHKKGKKKEKPKHYLRGFGSGKKLLLLTSCGKWSWNINNMPVRFNIQLSYDTRLEVYKRIQFSPCQPDCLLHCCWYYQPVGDIKTLGSCTPSFLLQQVNRVGHLKAQYQHCFQPNKLCSIYRHED